MFVMVKGVVQYLFIHHLSLLVLSIRIEALDDYVDTMHCAIPQYKSVVTGTYTGTQNFKDLNDYTFSVMKFKAYMQNTRKTKCIKVMAVWYVLAVAVMAVPKYHSASVLATMMLNSAPH